MRLLTVLSALLPLFFMQALDAQHFPPGCKIGPCSDTTFTCPEGFSYYGYRKCDGVPFGKHAICCPAEVTAIPRAPDSADG